MPIEILMPALSPTMTEGNLVKWCKNEGDKIEPGEVIAEIETDKATMEVEAVDEGTLGKIIVQAPTEDVKVNDLIALILEDGEKADSLKDYQASSSAPSEPKQVEAKSESVKAPAPQNAPKAGNERVHASPLAKRIAENENVNLANISGTGPHGRIIKADVLENLNNASSQPLVESSALGRNPEETRLVANSSMRKVIAKRLLESKQTIPHFYLSIECQLTGLMQARKRMNDAGAKLAQPVKISVNDFVIKAVANALKSVPEANASWSDDNIIYYNNVDISVAVAIDGGLITPIIKNADQKPLSAISAEMKDLAKRAKENALKPEEFQGGGFSISNLGMYGIKNFQAIVNPPQSCILAVGAGEEKLILENGTPKSVNVINVSLSCDHRVVDGAVAAQFLAKFKENIEFPEMMIF